MGLVRRSHVHLAIAALAGCAGLIDPGAAYAASTPDQCAAIIADAGASDGEPHLLASPVANRPQCPDSYLVDLFYKSNVTPGLYLSWAAAEPPSAQTCKAAMLEMRVWDMTAQPPALLGATKQAGAWEPNGDPVGNPGMASICNVPPIRAEASFKLQPGRKYRFALRAAGTSASPSMAFAIAPLASRTGGGAFAGGNWYVALKSSPPVGALDVAQWPADPFQLKLDGNGRRVSRGGDFAFYPGELYQPFQTYARLGHPNFGISNAVLVSKGIKGTLDDIVCVPYVKTQKVTGAIEYSYPAQGPTTVVGTAQGVRLCVLDGRNRAIYRLRVIKYTQPQPDLAVVGFKLDQATGRSTWGCLDGLCTKEAQVITEYTRPTIQERDVIVAKTLEYQKLARACIEKVFQRPLPVPLTMHVHAEEMTPSKNGSETWGLGGEMVTVHGFEGNHQPGQTRVENIADLRFEGHETTHVYNYHFFAKGKLPSWLDEGIAIQNGVRLDCGGSPPFMKDFWRAWKPGSTNTHQIGSEFFKRLQDQDQCNLPCAGTLWRAWVDAYAKDPDFGKKPITNAMIKSVAEKVLGKDLTELFKTLGLAV